MKDRRYKNIEDLIEDYLQLLDEQTELPVLLAKCEEKYNAFLQDNAQEIIKTNDAQEGFKIFGQIKKNKDRYQELQSEIVEMEGYLKEFLFTISGKQLSFEKKDDNKTKVTILFWIQDGQLQSKKS